jgi:hypothetical protein
MRSADLVWSLPGWAVGFDMTSSYRLAGQRGSRTPSTLPVCARLGGALGDRAAAALPKAALAFLPPSLIGADVDMCMGMKRGYSIGAELPFFLLVFDVLTATALLLWWKLR